MDKLISIGKILNFHGINGEVKVGYTAGKENQLESLKNVLISSGNKSLTLTVENIRFHKKFALIKFKELNTVNEVLDYKGWLIKIPKEDVLSTFEEDEYLIDDLVNCQIYDAITGELVGKVVEIANLKGQDFLIIIDLDEREHFVPFVKDIVPLVDIKNKKITINNIPGLIFEEYEQEFDD